MFRTRYVLAVVGILATLGSGLAIASSRGPHEHAPPKAAVAKAIPKNKSTTSSLPPGPMTTPKSLRIPSLNVTADVHPVGLTHNGDMSTPPDGQTVGWYKFGAIPGRAGNAVIDGHLDVEGKPAVLWNLRKLKPGDMVEVLDTQSQTAEFSVTRMQNFTPEKAPLEQIFGKTTKASLNLITCDGAWQRDKRDYTERLVVFTELRTVRVD